MTPRARLALAPALLAVGAALTATAGSATAATPTCHGLPVTTTASSGLVVGTPTRDVIRLTGPGHVRSGAGADIICGSRLADTIEAGAGDDVVLGGRGHDRLHGGAGHDHLYGEGGNDHLHGGPGGDHLHGGAGRNRVHKGAGPGARETGLAAAGPQLDAIVGGTYALSIITDRESAMTLMEQDAGFLYSWAADIPGQPGYPIAWQVSGPYLRTALAVGTGVWGYWSVNTSVMPGGMVSPTGQFPAGWGQTFAVSPIGSGGVGPVGPGPVGTVSVVNNSATAISAGLMLPGSVNGRPFTQAASAATLYSLMMQQFPRPTQLVVQVSPGWTAPGQVLGAPLGQQATVSFSPGQPTATLAYSAGGGFTTG